MKSTPWPIRVEHANGAGCYVNIITKFMMQYAL